MLDFIYDSLDTVKKLKFPTAKDVALLTIGIFAAVIVAGIYFVIADTIFSDGYRAFYTKIVASTGHAVETGAEDVLTASDVENMLSGATVQLLSGAAEEVATGAAQ